MADYLTSAEVLEKLCEFKLPRPYSCVWKIPVGGSLSAIGYGLGRVAWEIGDRLSPPGIAIEVMLGGLSLAVTGLGLYLLADSFASLRIPLGRSKDGSVYYRHEGFTNKSSIFDRIHGMKVTPIEYVEDLQSNPKGYVLINGFTVEDAKVSSTFKTAYTSVDIHPQPIIYKTPTGAIHTPGIGDTSTIHIPYSYFSHRAQLIGSLKGKKLTASIPLVSPYSDDDDVDDAERLQRLAETFRGFELCIMGELSKAQIIRIEEYWRTFQESQSS